MLIPIEEAWQRIANVVEPLEKQVLHVEDTLGLVCAEELRANVALPPFDNSAMDGYALRSIDTSDASPDNPVWLDLRGEIFAGDDAYIRVDAGTTVRIMTGAAMPRGCNAVLMLERARLREDRVEVTSPVTAGRHVRITGEDLNLGAVVAAPGDVLDVGRRALVASAGISAITCWRRPRLAILATGSELVEPGNDLGPGQIYDANLRVMCDLAKRGGYEVSIAELVGDDSDHLQERILEAHRVADVVVLSGGVSVGHRDYVKSVLADIGAERILWRVSMKPGKPLLVATLERSDKRSLIFGLPGNPISCLAGWRLFVLPALRTLAGNGAFSPAPLTAIVTEHITGDPERTRMVTVTAGIDADGRLVAKQCGSQGSAMIHSMAGANGFLQVDANANLTPGDKAKVFLFEPINDQDSDQQSSRSQQA